MHTLVIRILSRVLIVRCRFEIVSAFSLEISNRIPNVMNELSSEPEKIIQSLGLSMHQVTKLSRIDCDVELI